MYKVRQKLSNHLPISAFISTRSPSNSKQEQRRMFQSVWENQRAAGKMFFLIVCSVVEYSQEMDGKYYQRGSIEKDGNRQILGATIQDEITISKTQHITTTSNISIGLYTSTGATLHHSYGDSVILASLKNFRPGDETLRHLIISR